MCGLCGSFGGAGHWSDAPDDASGRPVLAERHRRVAAANPVLALFGLKLTPWADRFLLSGRTGKSAVVDGFGSLWPEAERLSGRACDPLDPEVIAAVDRLATARRPP